jgi:hypothetical protein
MDEDMAKSGPGSDQTGRKAAVTNAQADDNVEIVA